MMPNHEMKGDCYVNPCLSQVKDVLQFSKLVIREAFLTKQSIDIINRKEDNVFMMPNHEKKEDYYVNQCLSQLKYELQF